MFPQPHISVVPVDAAATALAVAVSTAATISAESASLHQSKAMPALSVPGTHTEYMKLHGVLSRMCLGIGPMTGRPRPEMRGLSELKSILQLQVAVSGYLKTASTDNIFRPNPCFYDIPFSTWRGTESIRIILAVLISRWMR